MNTDTRIYKRRKNILLGKVLHIPISKVWNKYLGLWKWSSQDGQKQNIENHN